ncbi:hypothetical protein RhiirA4_545218 [Rhizophagus irregularis]|uniref:Uncharacterized protein n=1 Tax=Rhizophagus irregularis TaxID=588596 RepID=A0A2I1GS13_9GLOM|nr:hypothetical protein RhiirA4_545218 [Rhizophagus irregularis]
MEGNEMSCSWNEKYKLIKKRKIAEIICVMAEGISQILFAVDGKFVSKEETEVLDGFHYYEESVGKDLDVVDTEPLRAIFDNDIHEHIIIVRTKFSSFKNED